MGRMGCDPPLALLEHFLKRMNQTDNLDVLFMPGDFIGNSVPHSDTNEYPQIVP